LASPGETLSLRDFENAARRRLPKSAFGFFAGGAEQRYPVIL
jgi:hypothetical protein